MNDREKQLQGFVNETQDLLKEMGQKAAGLVCSGDNGEGLREIFRIVHTIKGNASFFALANLGTVAHTIEELLSRLTANNLELDKPLIDLLWSGMNLAVLNIEAVKNNKVGAGLTADEEAFVSEVAKILAQRAPVSKVVSSNYRISDKVGYLCGETDVTRPMLIIKSFLEKAGENRADENAQEKFLAAVTDLSVVLAKSGSQQCALAAKKMLSDFQTLIGDNGQLSDFLLETLKEGFCGLRPAIKEVDIRDCLSRWREVKLPPDRFHLSFRVEKDKIDELLNTLHKLEVVKQDFGRLRNKMIEAGVAGEVVSEYQKILNSVNFFFRDMLAMIIKIKVTSPRLLLEKMEEITASLAQTCSKKIRINTAGKDIFVDRTKIELLERILPHMVRNCIDHGIETPQERGAQGKPQEGLITIEAVLNGKALTLTIADDGRGIDFQRLRKSMEEVSASADVSARGEDRQKAFFSPGNTTSNIVTELSGRGVGMDVVLRSLEKAGGTIEVFSELGKGTRFVITLPDN